MGKACISVRAARGLLCTQRYHKVPLIYFILILMRCGLGRFRHASSCELASWPLWTNARTLDRHGDAPPAGAVAFLGFLRGSSAPGTRPH